MTNLARVLRSLRYYVPHNKLAFDLAKRYVDDYLFQNNIDMYTNGELRLIRYVLANKSAPTIFDVGANIGLWCSEVLKIKPHAEIHCFEPSEKSFSSLINRNFRSNVKFNQIAVSSNANVVDYYIYGDTSEINSLHARRDIDPFRIEKVQTISIDGYCSQHGISTIDYLKIDAEGHDFEVLKGAQKMLSQNAIAFAQFEYGNNYIDSRVFLKDVFQFLGDFQYSINKICPSGTYPIREYQTELETLTNTNYLLISQTVPSS